jgi:membrane protease subunit HflK
MDGGNIKNFTVGQFNPAKIPVRAIGLGILALVVLWVALSSFYQVEPEERGLVIRFGKYVRDAGPGLHAKFPRPIERVFKVAEQRQLKEEFGFRTEEAGTRTRYSASEFRSESVMLTGDLNVADVEWITQFRIREPYDYLFKVRNVPDTFRDMNEAVMREVVGDRSVTEVLTVGSQEVASEVKLRLQELCDQYEMGVKVEQVVLQDVNPPEEVKDAFNEVNQAQQEKERMINEALAEFNRIIPKARGEALQTIEQAEGYATDRVNRSKGDASRFKALLAAYRRAPEVTRRRIYLETMNQIYPKIKNKVILDADAKNVLPLLNLNGASGVSP